MKVIVFAFALLLIPCPTFATNDPSEFRIHGLFIGMTEKQLQDSAGALDRRASNVFDDASFNERIEIWSMHKDRAVLIGVHKGTHKVVYLTGAELTKQGSSVAMEGDYPFRVALGLMPLQHDDDWTYHLEKVTIAVELQVDAAKTGPTILRFIVADPSLPVRGGFAERLTPRPGSSDPGLR